MRRSKARSTLLRTLLALAVFAALLAYVLLVETRRAPPVDPEATPTPWPILGWEMDELQAVHVSDGQREARLERRDKEWHFVTPSGAARADPRAIYLPLLEWSALDARLMVSAEVTDWAPYGLDDPSLTVTIEKRSGERERIDVGRETPDGTAFYVASATQTRSARPPGERRLYLIDHYKVELLTEWLSHPPLLRTPTPGGP